MRFRTMFRFFSTSKACFFSSQLISDSLLILGSGVTSRIGYKGFDICTFEVFDENKRLLFAQQCAFMNYSYLRARPLRVSRFQSWMCNGCCIFMISCTLAIIYVILRHLHMYECNSVPADVVNWMGYGSARS